MTIAKTAAVPVSLNDWDVSAMTLHGTRRITARRTGVTWMFAEIVGGWRLTSFIGGKVVLQREVRHTPTCILPFIPQHRPRPSRSRNGTTR